MVRVCFFCGDCSLGGGTERVCTALASSMCEYGGYEVFILSITESNAVPIYPSDPRITRSVLRNKKVGSYASYITLYSPLISFLKKNRIDIVVDVDAVLDIISLPARAFTGVKVISWVHFAFDETLGTSYRTILRRLTAKHTDAVVTLTHGDAERYNSTFGLRHPAVCIRNAMGEASQTPYSLSSRTIITAGSLVPVKGYDFLVEVAAIVLNAHPECRWKIFGEGEERGAIEAKIREHGLEGRLLLCGFVDDLAAQYENACVYVLTSRSEGLPTVILESKQHRLPIVAFASANGISELIRDRVNGFLIPFGDIKGMADAICALVEDDGLRASFSAHAADNTEEFKPEYIIKQWDKLIKEIKTA